jgi:CRP-like cAMP-binding protein
MVDETLLNQLRSLKFTAGLPEHVLAAIADVVTEEDLPAGTRIFREGTEYSKMLVIISGRVMLDMHVPSRGCVSILSLGPGDMVGWSAVVSDAVMTASATAATDTHLLAFEGHRLEELCEQNHEFGYRFYQQMASALSRRLLATRLQLLDLFASDPPPIEPDADRRDRESPAATQTAGNKE